LGRVYRAVDTDGTPVALKLIRPEHGGDPTFRRRFARETKAALAVRHPHVVPVLSAGEHEGAPYLATAFLAGGSLDARLREHGALGLERTVKLLLQVAGGLDALHAAGLVHRDVKPGNILLDETGGAFITDFGLAKSRDASALTRTGFAVGSMPYMAPEQARAEDVTAAADVYALGCVVFECLAGRPPFAGRRGVQMLSAHLYDEPPDPCDGRDDGSPELTWAVLRALAQGAGRAAADGDQLRAHGPGGGRRAAAQPGPLSGPSWSSSSVAPIRTRSPGPIACCSATRSSLTQTPLVDSRSWITTTPSSTETTA
jgi:serine/threonine protein kinase